ncbi:MAG TPA: two-component regulator propeller domain-containing protein, partial [Cyclobacteriaceae bacterium]
MLHLTPVRRLNTRLVNEEQEQKIMMSKKYAYINTFFLLFVFCISAEGQIKTDLPKDNTKTESIDGKTSHGPRSIIRSIIQDRKGNIWMTSWEGVFRYDGKWFTNMTSNVSSARFFSILEDRRGNLWFGSIGEGVFRYDARLPDGQGKSFQNFRIKDGLVNNDIVSIYEDKTGNIWFGAWGGASRYDGKSFRNYIIDEDSMYEDQTGKTFPDRLPYEVNSIIEDKTGKLWFATRGNTFVYDGKTFTVFRRNDDKPFINVRTIIEDRKGNIWLAGNDGLWRYDGRAFTNFIKDFAGYVYEDKKGNIWTSSESDKKGNFGSTSRGSTGQESWTLSRYNEKSLSDKNAVPEIIRAKEGMVFGILEANDGSIWFGTLDG